MNQRVLSVMMPVLLNQFGNPSSVQHGTGRLAGNIMEDARKKVAEAVNMHTSDVIFTSGATEANNLAIAGLKRHTACVAW